MQYSYIHKLLIRPGFHHKNLVIKIIVFVVALYFVTDSLTGSHIFKKGFVQQFFQSGASLKLLYCALILMPFNWALETFKWKYLAGKHEPLSFVAALRGILCGVTLSFFTPAGAGDYIGRLFQLKSDSRETQVSTIFLTNVCQFYITFCIGAAALLYMLYQTNGSDFLFLAMLSLVLLSVGILVVLIFGAPRFIYVIKKIDQLKPLFIFFKLLKKITIGDVTLIMLLSLIRYAVFAAQFMLLLHYFHISGSFMFILSGIGFVFFTKTLVPTFFDVGVREAAALFYFSSVGAPEDIVKACLLLWGINVLIPVILGLFTIPTMHFKPKPA